MKAFQRQQCGQQRATPRSIDCVVAKCQSRLYRSHAHVAFSSRRDFLGFPFLLLPSLQLLQATEAAASRLRSVTWNQPCFLTVINSTPLTVKAYWLNYDGDAELCSVIDPGSSWAVDTFASHPWRFVDADTGDVIQEFVASTAKPQILRLSDIQAQDGGSSDAWSNLPKAGDTEDSSEFILASRSEGVVDMEEFRAEDSEEFDGWDGIGGSENDYAQAMVAGIALKSAGGLLRLLVSGFRAPLDLYSAKDDAASVLMAYTAEPRRPLTTLTWTNTLKATGADVSRVLITRVVNDTFYCRIVLSLPGGQRRSIDSRPTDGLALALQSDRPIYVAKSIGRLQVQLVDTGEPQQLPDRQGGLPPSIVDNPEGMKGAGVRPPPRPAGPKEAFPFGKAILMDA